MMLRAVSMVVWNKVYKSVLREVRIQTDHSRKNNEYSFFFNKYMKTFLFSF